MTRARARGAFTTSLRGPAAAAGLRLPWAISYDPEHRVLECEALDGRPLAALEGSELERGMRRLGAALANLHRLDVPPVDPTVRAPRADGAAARRSADRRACARTAPARPRELADRLVAERPQAAPAVCLHGDVHPKNVLVGDGGLALVDLDQVALGPAAADVGGILAGLRYRRLIGELSDAAEGALAQAVLDGYAAAGGRARPRGPALAHGRGAARRARPARDHQGSPAGHRTSLGPAGRGRQPRWPPPRRWPREPTPAAAPLLPALARPRPSRPVARAVRGARRSASRSPCSAAARCRPTRRCPPAFGLFRCRRSSWGPTGRWSPTTGGPRSRAPSSCEPGGSSPPSMRSGRGRW